MSMKALPTLAVLMVCLAARPAMAATLTQTAIDEKPMTFQWNITWDRSFAAHVLQGPPPMKYWVSSFSIVSLDGDRVFNDIAVQLRHRALGPEEAELLDHDDGKPYDFEFRNALDKLDAPLNVTQNIPGSIQWVPHRGGSKVNHRDDIRVEFKRRGDAVDFQVNAVHVDAPVPEPATWGLLVAGLAALGLSRRLRGAAE